MHPFVEGTVPLKVDGYKVKPPGDRQVLKSGDPKKGRGSAFRLAHPVHCFFLR